MVYILYWIKKGLVHWFIWVFNTPNIENEAIFIEFIEETRKAQSPDDFNDPEIFKSVKTDHIHAHNRTC